MRKITINGREYDGLETMPPDVRSLYEDALRRSGRPVADPGDGPDLITVRSEITVNGKTYASAEEMPAEVRGIYLEAMARARAGAAQPGEERRVQSSVSFVLGDSHGRRVGGATVEIGIRGVLTVLACLGAAVAAWLLFQR